MITRTAIRKLLAPFDVSISDETADKVSVYADLLFRWNRKINLTSISTPEECITRHFGESFLVSRMMPLRGVLLDIGSGAGFPGLAIKLIAPELEVVLLEPVAKKRAFLKEVARVCGLGPVQVVGSRFDEFARTNQGQSFNIITARAVGGLELLIPLAEKFLCPDGHLCLWLGTQQVGGVRQVNSDLRWLEAEAIPVSHNRFLLVGVQTKRKFE